MTSKIMVLDEFVANQIAAGEVIERPASIVKELVENSIDAGSTRIQVEIEDGGRKSIRVLDNGEGILQADVLTAFQRHATSKIREATDLFSIRTLGFRGEALPSIASISKVTLKTRTADESVGTLIHLEGGELKEERELGMAPGTDFLIEDIFFNTPARYKYLKTATTELGQISDLFNRIALAEPQISMSLLHNGKLVNRTPGTGRLRDTILSIYGREMVDNLIEVEHEESYVKISGMITNPTVYRSSRKHQTFFVNGRYVKSTLLGRGVDDGYSNLLPPGRHPVVFLFVQINPIHVDVNVHPAKFEVKFSRPEIVMDAVTKGVRKALLGANYLPSFKPIKKIVESRVNPVLEKSLFDSEHLKDFEGFMPNNNEDDTGTEASIDASPLADANAGASTSVSYPDDLFKQRLKPEDIDHAHKTPDILKVKEKPAKLEYIEERASQKNWDPLKGHSKTTQTRSAKDYQNVSAEPKSIASKEPITQKSSRRGEFIADLLPIGQIHRTYIIAQGKDGFYVIDQHVAHERILYEELMTSFRTKGVTSQTLLLPITLELTLKEIQIIQENMELFEKLGFTLEHFGGNTVIIRAVPKRIDNRPDKDLFLEIVDLFLEDKRGKDRAQLYNRLITALSCKGAIKAGEHLEQGEMIRLLQNLSKTENPLFCPHGRPILFHISEHDLLKAFHRI